METTQSELLKGAERKKKKQLPGYLFSGNCRGGKKKVLDSNGK